VNNKILILSDTHGDQINYLNIIKKEQPDLTVHAGDYKDDKSINFNDNLFKKNVNIFIGGNHGINAKDLEKYQNKIIKSESINVEKNIKKFVLLKKSSKDSYVLDFLSKDYKIFKFCDKKFLLIHLYIPAADDMWPTRKWKEYKKHIKKIIITNNIDYVIFGHTHHAVIINDKEVTYGNKNKLVTFLNPGSITKPREQTNKTYIVGTKKGNKINFTIKEID